MKNGRLFESMIFGYIRKQLAECPEVSTQLTEPFGKEDMQGVDILIWKGKRLKAKIQVKESWHAMKEYHWHQYEKAGVLLLCGDFEAKGEFQAACQAAMEHGVLDWFLDSAVTRRQLVAMLKEPLLQ